MALSSAADGLPGKISIWNAQSVAAKIKTLTIVDARNENAFRKGHIPGSRMLDWSRFTLEKPSLINALTGDPARWGKIKEPSPELQKDLRALGLSKSKPIVVVGDPKAWGEEGRIAWNLLYWGADDVILLDGGFPAWKGVTEAGPEKRSRPGDFIVTARPERRATLEMVKAALSEKQSPFDVRTPEEFAGKPVNGQKRGGRLPGAKLVALSTLYNPDGTFITAEQLKKIVGETKASPIAYCVGGVRSALFTMLVEARLGRTILNYDGSMWEYSAHKELPLEK